MSHSKQIQELRDRARQHITDGPVTPDYGLDRDRLAARRESPKPLHGWRQRGPGRVEREGAEKVAHESREVCPVSLAVSLAARDGIGVEQEVLRSFQGVAHEMALPCA